MQDKVGEIFAGSVSAVVPFGLFVALDEVFVEGLVHISELGSDYFQYDETRHALLGERTGAQYRLSDRVTVQVLRVDLETNKIDFRLVDAPAESATPSAGEPPPAHDGPDWLTASERAARRAKSKAGAGSVKSADRPAGKSSRRAQSDTGKKPARKKKEKGSHRG